MILYHAGVDRANYRLLAAKAGSRNLLVSYGYNCDIEAAVQETITAVDVPDSVGQAFLKTGLPQTVEAFIEWLQKTA